MERSSEVKDFYDKFADEVLLEDFRRFNLRQEAVGKFCAEFVPEGARVLEIGCGVGINARRLLKRASRVVGVDISGRNVEIARAYVRSDSAEFRVLDVLHAGEELVALGPFDAVVLPDVIEHIPKDRHADLFAAIERVLARPGLVLLTYPSPGYQRYLKENRPQDLQIVDEAVTLEELLRHTALELVFFKHRDVWQRRQYVHVVLASSGEYRPEEPARTAAERFVYRLKKRWWRLRHRRFVTKITRRPSV
jgi:2-polyprenyl-3-methyl-5-hydroxy-6-metoxy-1,4-benzoquinol methylase